MADYVPLSGDGKEKGKGKEKEEEEEREGFSKEKRSRRASARLESLDVFRGLSVALMIYVDYAGSIFPSIAHSPWNGIRLADFVTPFFLFIVGVSVSLVYKNVSNRYQSSQKAMLRAVKLFMLGVLLQGGYFHGLNSLTFGVDIEKIRWLGILQRIAIGYIIAALCEIWFSSLYRQNVGGGFFRNYYLQWIVVFSLSGIHLGLLYGLYVPDWQYKVQQTTSSSYSLGHDYFLKSVKCGVRGDLGPACNSAGMIDRYVLGIEHLYTKPAYRNLQECSISRDPKDADYLPSWCHAPFDPEGILGSLMAAVTCIIGVQFGHVLVQVEDHKDRLIHWLLLSISSFSLGLMLTFMGFPINKQLYSTSYMLLTTGAAGFTFCVLYLLVDVCGYRWLMFVLKWIGKHSLSIFILVASNIAIILIQGFYWRDAKNNIVHWFVSLFVQK
ncbi:heparan-alpha-glucosaminide N-acetyltransferase-like [Iris pallida]|uniref:Heparan-alpha-glucosaminide N-acetyltransferase-like n=1 Tax=Iris pallida TaxID=29817 RepID=A0AAX6EEC3_IRIPA|nr:heparan-alpha-glucosaminide N-acetyltransferase-like [Iris pallida]